MRELGPFVVVGILAGGCFALLGCGSDTKTVTEIIEVETRTTVDGEGPDEIARFCSSPMGEEVDALSAEAGQALEQGDDGTLLAIVEEMIGIAEASPPGARCVYAPFDSVKILLHQHPDVIRRITQVQQDRELTEADVERIESE